MPGFQERFNREVMAFIKTIAPKGSINEDKLRYELQFIAERCKKRNLGAREYLRTIIRLASDAAGGNHSKMEFHTGRLELEK